MHCPLCSGDTHVIDSRPKETSIYRRRECRYCGKRFSTNETLYKLLPKYKAEKEIFLPCQGGRGHIGVTTATLIEMNQRWNTREIAERIGCSQGAILYRFRTAGHKPVKHLWKKGNGK